MKTKLNNRKLIIGIFAILAVAIVVVFATSGNIFQGKSIGGECAQDSHCDAGEKCFKNLGKCVKLAETCKKNADCGSGKYCHSKSKTCVKNQVSAPLTGEPVAKPAAPKPYTY